MSECSSTNGREANNRERIIVQRLINALDDSRSLYDKAAGKVTHPRLQDLLESIACVHWLIANDLAAQLVESGGEVTRCGSRLGPWRTFLAERSARISIDIDMAYARQAAKREGGILRGFRNAGSIRNTALRSRFKMHCAKLERASMKIRRLRATMELRAGPLSWRALATAHVSTQTYTPQVAVRNSHHSNE